MDNLLIRNIRCTFTFEILATKQVFLLLLNLRRQLAVLGAGFRLHHL